MPPLFFRVRIGDDVFRSGDRRITYLAIELSEDARSSNCRFELYDPGLAIAGKYFLASYETGGIQVPSDLIAPPQPVGSVAVAGTTSGSFSATEGVGGDAESNIRLVIAECQKQGVTDASHIAYILGTMQHESNYLPVEEGYYLGDEASVDAFQQSLHYYPYFGRGFVQLTWDYNYRKYGELMGLDFIANPDLLLRPDVAAFIIVHGMKTGGFTGVGLSEYGSESSFDFVGARAIVNGNDQDALIAGYAQEWLTKLPSYLGSTPVPAPAPAPATPPIQDEAKAINPEATEAAPTPTPAPASPQKGTEIIVEVGQTADNAIAYHFIHTGTSAKGRAPDTVAFTGKSIRWEMSRRTINTTWQNITLREVAQQVCDAYGRLLEMEGDGPTYAFLDATGISYMDLLRRECRSIGYRITDNGNTLILEPYRPQFTGFVVARNILISCNFSDEATAEGQASAAVTTSSAPNPTAPDEQAAEAVLEANPLTGEIEQANPENSTGTGEGEAAVVTGSPTPPITGVVQTPDEQTTQIGDMTEVIEQQIPDNPLPTYAGIKPEDVTGLPTQQIGTIDLADGSAQAEVIRDESRRVKGYPSTIEIILSPATLQLAPGSIIALAQNCFDNEIAREAFAKEWRVGNAKHQIYPNRQTTLEIYTPQAQKPPQTQSTAAATTTSAAPGQAATGVTLSPGNHIWPMALEGNSSCGEICEFGYARGRLHAGLDFGGYGAGDNPDAVWATLDGVVDFTGLAGGYGNMVDILHPDGILTRYAHLASISVQQGAQVTQGQVIGIRGGTGASGGEDYAIHLHFEMRPGSSAGSPGEPVDPRTLLPSPGLP